MSVDHACPIWLETPLRGTWRDAGYPEEIELELNGRIAVFRRTYAYLDRPGVVASYREAAPEMSHHLYVFENGEMLCDHVDCANPDWSLPQTAVHLHRDLGLGGVASALLVVGAVAGAAMLGVGIVRALRS